MKFYLIEADDLGQADYAQFSHLGTWIDDELCEECGQPTAKLIQPLLIEWDKYSNIIGDFSWCGYTCIVTEEAKNNLTRIGTDCIFGNVIDKTNNYLLKDADNNTYINGFKWLIPNKYIKLDEEKSSIKLLINCKTCNQMKYNFKREGLYINKKDIINADIDIFYISQYLRTDAIFITEELKNMISKGHMKNIKFVEAGVIY